MMRIAAATRFIGALLTGASLQGLAGCATFGDDAYRPSVGQHGKDVMWVPTLDYAVLTMLERAKVTADDLVIDLGSGDGRIPIEASRRYGARAVGIEYNAELTALAKREATRAGVTDRVRMIHGDIFKEDFSAATVLTLYLGRELNLKLKPTILTMAPGTRVVSNTFDMGLWEPDDVVRNPQYNNIYYWTVPARVDGEWRVSGVPGFGDATLRLRQRFQKVEGELVGDRSDRPTRVEGRLDGRRMALSLRDAPGMPLRLEVDATGSNLGGHTGSGEPVRGTKLR
jgi:SAM-dependent methyltransferase